MTRTKRALLSRARTGMTPSRADRARMRRRLLASLGAVGATGAAATAAAATASGTALGTSAPLKALLLLVATTMAAGVGYTVLDARRTRDPGTEHVLGAAPRIADLAEPAATVTAEESTPLEVAFTGQPANAPVVPFDVETASAPSVRTSAPSTEARVAAVPVPPIVAADNLRDETSLIGRARRILREDPAAALRVLDEHARRFPDGLLTEERAVQRVRAYCALGEVERAEREAARFRRDYPTSLNGDALVALCQSP